ncbi:MAG: RluA family pseudouridine synthase [Deltaproteobacteria bacterium]|nr:RluA family pseudouridine synthase [Deltaproteobacteria bacterium]
MASSDGSSFAFEVGAAEGGLRLDQYLAGRELPQTRSQLKRCIDAGCCLVNAQVARPARRLRAGDRVVYTPPPPVPSDVLPEAIALVVLFEDDQVVVVDKPAGMVVHPAAGHRSGTLVAALLAHCGELAEVGGVLRPGIVHRLDKLTSGVLVASKTDAAHGGLAAQFKAHSVERRYLALAAGELRADSGRIETAYGRHPTERKRFTSRVPTGRRAVTHFQVVERFVGATLVEARLETGRTHQVRVHFAEHLAPLLGDPTYGRAPRDARLREVGRALGRQALHAQVLGFDHPRSGERLRFVSPVPEDFAAALAALRSGPP